MFFGYNRSYSVTLMLAELSLPCFDNFMAAEQWSLCFNRLVSNLHRLQLWLVARSAFYFLFFVCYFLCLYIYIYTLVLLSYE